MPRPEINPKIAHIIIAPVKGLTYSFYPDGRVFVEGVKHRYYFRLDSTAQEQPPARQGT